MDDISVYVLKPFHFSRNGVKEEYADVGKTLPIPDRLFAGLNKEGYVRRAEIGDGHFSLRPNGAVDGEFAAGFSDIVEVQVNSAMEPATTVSPVVESSPSSRISDTIKSVVSAAKSVVGVTAPAPRPASATAKLTEEEARALADGSWQEWKFFTQKSVAAKISDKPIVDGADVKAAIEAFIAAHRD